MFGGQRSIVKAELEDADKDEALLTILPLAVPSMNNAQIDSTSSTYSSDFENYLSDSNFDWLNEIGAHNDNECDSNDDGRNSNSIISDSTSDGAPVGTTSSSSKSSGRIDQARSTSQEVTNLIFIKNEIKTRMKSKIRSERKNSNRISQVEKKSRSPSTKTISPFISENILGKNLPIGIKIIQYVLQSIQDNGGWQKCMCSRQKGVFLMEINKKLWKHETLNLKKYWPRKFNDRHFISKINQSFRVLEKLCETSHLGTSNAATADNNSNGDISCCPSHLAPLFEHYKKLKDGIVSLEFNGTTCSTTEKKGISKNSMFSSGRMIADSCHVEDGGPTTDHVTLPFPPGNNKKSKDGHSCCCSDYSSTTKGKKKRVSYVEASHDKDKEVDFPLLQIVDITNKRKDPRRIRTSGWKGMKLVSQEGNNGQRHDSENHVGKKRGIEELRNELGERRGVNEILDEIGKVSDNEASNNDLINQQNLSVAACGVQDTKTDDEVSMEDGDIIERQNENVSLEEIANNMMNDMKQTNQLVIDLKKSMTKKMRKVGKLVRRSERYMRSYVRKAKRTEREMRRFIRREARETNRDKVKTENKSCFSIMQNGSMRVWV